MVNSIIMTSDHSAANEEKDPQPRGSEVLTQQMKRELQIDTSFRAHCRELTLRGDLAWKGDKIYIPKKLWVQVL